MGTPKDSHNYINLFNYLLASSIATAQATVIPTMGLLPAPIRPIISTHPESVDKRPFYNIARKPCYNLLFNTFLL